MYLQLLLKTNKDLLPSNFLSLTLKNNLLKLERMKQKIMWKKPAGVFLFQVEERPLPTKSNVQLLLD